MTLPGNPFIAYRGGSLVIDDCRVVDLARRFGTPLYLYSRTAMQAAFHAYADALANRDHLICYAVKANSNLAVLEVFADMGCGFDIVSIGELERVLAIGVDGSRIVFSGVGKTRAEMHRALEVGVRCFNVESEGELDLLSQVATAARQKARISLRINPDIDAKTHAYISTGLRSNKFGIAHSHAVAAYRRAASLPAIEIVGIDCHIGSQITEIAPYLEALDRLLDLVERIEEADAAAPIRIAHLDVGGGLGIVYADETPPRPDALMRALLERIDARGHGHRQLLLEPGRSLVGNAGVLASEVLYLKPGDEKNFCIVDAAMNDLARPTMYDAWMRIVECEQRRDVAPVVYDVVGPVCESGDWLGHDRDLRVLQGDVVTVLSAGAYAMSMASNYNTRGRAAEVMVAGDRAWLVRERESVTDQLRNELAQRRPSSTA